MLLLYAKTGGLPNGRPPVFQKEIKWKIGNQPFTAPDIPST